MGEAVAVGSEAGKLRSASIANTFREHFPFPKERTIWYGYARMALLSGLGWLGLAMGDEILVPEFICNVALAPLHTLKLKISYYKLDAHFRPVWQDVERLCVPATRAMMVVNYFGFPNALEEARAFCNRHNMYLIEDNAHSFLSAGRVSGLGSYGDFSVFSLHKSIDISAGAALVIGETARADQRLLPTTKLRRFPLRRLLRWQIRSFLRRIALGRTSFLDANVPIMREADRAQEYDISGFDVEMPYSSTKRIQSLDLNQHKIIRREMYGGWLDCLRENPTSELTPIFGVLGDGVIPLVFPVRARNTECTIGTLRKHGLACYPWPFFPERLVERLAQESIICIPIHKRYDVSSYRNLLK